MFCEKCQNVLNLDILMATHPGFESNGGGSRPYPHHENYNALETSAKTGCELCKMMLSAIRHEVHGLAMKSLTGSDAKILFEFNYSDILFFIASKPKFTLLHRPHHGIRLSAIEGDSITKLTEGAFTTRPQQSDSGSAASFRLATYWLGTCLETHSKCLVKESQLPTRVIDVGRLEAESVSLYISQDESGKWLTLSHRWGSDKPITTTEGNLKSHCEGIKVSELPQTFQDAVLITRKLGYRYLWIDSLCIIQDSISDWSLESVKMAEIYSNALLNLSADASANAFEGIFKTSNEKVLEKFYPNRPWRPKLVPFPVHSAKHGIQSNVYAAIYKGDSDTDPGLLQERAWVFQEAALSPRRLRYTYKGLIWNCAAVNDICNEIEPHEIHNDYSESYIDSIYHIPYNPLPERTDSDTIHTQTALCWWYLQVDSYVQRLFTFPKDRMPAMSGLAKAFSERTGYHYKAGIWLEDLHRGLLWTSCGLAIDQTNSPSWSWAVIEGDLGLPSVYNNQALWKYAAAPAEVIDIRVKNKDDNPFGHVESASIRLRGPCKALADLAHSQQFIFWDHLAAWHDRHGNPGTGQSNRDAVSMWMDTFVWQDQFFWERRDILLVQVAQFQRNPEQYVWQGPDDPPEIRAYSLVLEHTGQSDDIFRRIGVARMPVKITNDVGWEMRAVTIV